MTAHAWFWLCVLWLVVSAVISPRVGRMLARCTTDSKEGD
jgi:amino acid permease